MYNPNSSENCATSDNKPKGEVEAALDMVDSPPPSSCPPQEDQCDLEEEQGDTASALPKGKTRYSFEGMRSTLSAEVNLEWIMHYYISSNQNDREEIEKMKDNREKLCLATSSYPPEIMDDTESESQTNGAGDCFDGTTMHQMKEVITKCTPRNRRPSLAPALIGDYSKLHCLPLVKSRHDNLKAIDNHTLAKLICGIYKDIIESFKIIDCRYPYEYEGGHIINAVNLYTSEMICQEFLDGKTHNPIIQKDGEKRNILIFHCEFSSKRGPYLLKFLRNYDRLKNIHPKLYYPEIYLLEGGYMEFFNEYSQLCEPRGYRKMNDENFLSELNKFHYGI